MKMRGFLLSVLLIISAALGAQVVPGKVRSVSRDGNDLVFKCQGKIQAKVSILADDLFRVQMSEDGRFDRSKMVDWGYVKADWPACDFELKEEKELVEIRTASLVLKVYSSSFRICLEDLEGKLLLRESNSMRSSMGDRNTLAFDMPADEHFFGFGFMRKTLDARGSKLTWTRATAGRNPRFPFL